MDCGLKVRYDGDWCQHPLAQPKPTCQFAPTERAQTEPATWQGLYLFEHRTRPHRREVVLQVMGG